MEHTQHLHEQSAGNARIQPEMPKRPTGPRVGASRPSGYARRRAQAQAEPNGRARSAEIPEGRHAMKISEEQRADDDLIGRTLPNKRRFNERLMAALVLTDETLNNDLPVPAASYAWEPAPTHRRTIRPRSAVSRGCARLRGSASSTNAPLSTPSLDGESKIVQPGGPQSGHAASTTWADYAAPESQSRGSLSSVHSICDGVIATGGPPPVETPSTHASSKTMTSVAESINLGELVVEAPSTHVTSTTLADCGKPGRHDNVSSVHSTGDDVMAAGVNARRDSVSGHTPALPVQPRLFSCPRHRRGVKP